MAAYSEVKVAQSDRSATTNRRMQSPSGYDFPWEIANKHSTMPPALQDASCLSDEDEDEDDARCPDYITDRTEVKEVPKTQDENKSHPMGKLPTCYCGCISRSDSEKILQPEPPGTYLLRVSETRSGYTLSLRTINRCKHFAIEQHPVTDKFVVVGEKPKFQNFNDLIRFYKVHPISPHGDLLRTPLKRQALLDFYDPPASKDR